MKKLIALFAYLLLLTVPTNDLLADGADVVLLLHSGSEVSGELLSVRENAFVIARTSGASDEVLDRFPDSISVVLYENVQKVSIEGNSYLLLGLGLGLVTGAAVGFAVGVVGFNEETRLEQLRQALLPSERRKSVFAATSIGGVIGLALGTAVGAAASTGDTELEISTLKSPYSLKPYARYQTEEPEFLKAIEAEPTGN